MEHALQLAQGLQLELCVIHVESGPRQPGNTLRPAAESPVLASVTTRAKALGMTCEGRLISGDIVEAVLTTASNPPCSAVVLGSRGVIGWSRPRGRHCECSGGSDRPTRAHREAFCIRLTPSARASSTGYLEPAGTRAGALTSGSTGACYPAPRPQTAMCGGAFLFRCPWKADLNGFPAGIIARVNRHCTEESVTSPRTRLLRHLTHQTEADENVLEGRRAGMAHGRTTDPTALIVP